MALVAGTRLGPYEIEGPLGAGGMGEVYRARDGRLDRIVAVKVLPEDFARDPSRLGRFQREAKAVAALSHPSILAIHDFGEHDGTAYAVMELLEGETLRRRLAGGALPPRKAVEYAAQVASGLAAAHEKSIVHRDLKPENLFLTTDGRVKILDFGLAAHREEVAGQSSLPTETRGTDPGTVLGTAGYMSPEQAAGQKADGRSDLFSLGCVLYEMLSGKRAFVRDTMPETLTAILREDPPPLSDLSPPLPDPLERLVLHCLEKRPEDRFQSARDLAFALQALSGSGISGAGVHVPGRRAVAGRLRWLWPVVTLAALGVATAAVVALARRPAGRAATRRATFLDIALPPGVRLDEPAFARLSPDGRQLVFVGLDQQTRRLWLRSLDSATARPLPAAEGGWPVTWSRDGRRIAFNAPDGQIKEVEVGTGAVRALGALPKGNFGDSTGTWNQAGDLVFSWWALFRIPASGGGPTVAALPEAARGELFFDAPQFLPDGRHYLFGALGVTPDQSGVYVSVQGSSDRRLLLRSVSLAAFAPPGYLLFQREATLFVQRFDPGRLELSGEPDRLVDGVFVSTWRHPTAWVAGETLAFVSGPPQRFQFTWFDRTGRKSGQVGDPAEIITFDLSPDGARVVAQLGFPGSLWLIDTSRGTSMRLTKGEEDGDPRFSGDAREVLFDRGLEDRSGLYRIRLDGGGQLAVLHEPQNPERKGSPMRPFAHDWSSDGRVALYHSGSLNGVWSVPISGDGKPRPVVQGTGVVDQASFSPDGRWVAYNGDETGRMEVFVIRYPPTGERWQVSSAGGVQPMWRGDGRELFYLDPQGSLVSVDVKATRTFAIGPPRVLFRTGLGNPSSFVEEYGVTADGQRFLLKMPAADTRPPELKLVLDWPALLGQQSRPAGEPPP
jgi:Tol biopolymer transport system component